MSSEEPGGAIVIAGGYGHVGRALAERLSVRYPDRIVLARRNPRKAMEAAEAIGHGCRGIQLDTAAGVAPAGASTVIMCLDQLDPSFASSCLSAGVNYVDVTAHGRILEMVEALGPAARRSGASGLIDVGLAPGLTNLLARLLSDTLEDVVRLDLFVLLGIGDDHGPAAISWTLDRFDSEFIVYQDDQPVRVRAQRETESLQLPDRRFPVPAVRFDFPEQRSLHRTLGVPTVSSWLTTLPPAATRSMRLAALSGIGGLTRRPRSRQALLSLLTRGGIGTDECGVLVRATNGAGETLSASVFSRDQSGLTAAATALMTEAVVESEIPEGVHHSDQVIEPRTLLRRLSEADPTITFSLPDGVTITR